MNIKLNLTLLLVLLSSIFLCGQNRLPGQYKMAKTLNGEINILCLFVDTADGEWEDEEKEYYYNQLLKSEEWLTQQASSYAKDIYFEHPFFFLEKEQIYIQSVDRNPSIKTFELAIEKLGYRNYEDFKNRNNFDFQSKALKIVFFVHDNARSFARRHRTGTDFTIVYTNSKLGTRTDYKTVSHELLHLFGAWDLYYGVSQRDKNARKLKELYPNSIMISTWRNDAAEVDELSAWRVGWAEYKEEFEEFKPEYDPDRNATQKRKKSTSLKFDLKKKKN